MGSTSNIENDLREVVGTAKNIDRISSLPDDILGRILSALSTKHAVATSVLSSRWRYLFTLIDNLDFHDDDLEMFDDDLGSLFKSFVEGVLRLCKCPNINRFTLKCHSYRNPLSSYMYDPLFSCEDLNTILSFVVDHKVRELDMFLQAFKLGDLPFYALHRNLFSCENLGVLKLDGDFYLDVPLSICLPFLRIVHLYSVEFLDNDSVTRFFTGCPVLEEFTAVECEWENVEVVDIFAPALRRLTLEHQISEYSVRRHALVLNCPNLLYFRYDETLAAHYSMVIPAQLVEAKINVFNHEDSLVRLLTGLCNVTRLSFAKILFWGVEIAQLYTSSENSSFRHLNLNINSD